MSNNIENEDVIFKLTHDLAVKLFIEACKDDFDRNHSNVYMSTPRFQMAWEYSEQFYQQFRNKIVGKKLDFLIGLPENANQ